MQGVRGGEHLPAPAHQEPMQGVRGGGASASTSAEGANARSAGGQASASTSAGGANARSAGEGLDDKWLVKIGFGVVVSTSLSESCKSEIYYHPNLRPESSGVSNVFLKLS